VGFHGRRWHLVLKQRAVKLVHSVHLVLAITENLIATLLRRTANQS
jgi:hypothetical protein